MEGNGEAPKTEVGAPKVSFVRKILNNITVEPLVICWLLPFVLTYSSIENLNFEKACRGFVEADIGFDKDICKIFVRKEAFSIDCNGTVVSSIETIDRVALGDRYPEIYGKIKDNLTPAMDFLCDVEIRVQEKLSAINAIRNPISAIGPLIIILFAGPWSDKKNLRVPCMLVPLLGEAIGYLSLFISAIFIDGPVEFPAYAYRLLPSLTGAENLMVMAIFSYLSAISTEENRTFRFGLFQILMTIVPIVAQSLSPTINENFEYAPLFGMMVPIHILGLLYTIIFLKEVKQEKKAEVAAYDNPALETEVGDVTTLEIQDATTDKARNACLEFFDFRLAVQCVRTFIKKRDYGIRTILFLLMAMHFITMGMSNGETQNMFLYQRVSLGWDIEKATYHSVYSIVMGLLGTLFAVGVLSKYLKVPDILLAIISTGLTVVSRTIYSIVKSTVGFFIGTTVDFCFSVKFLGSRAIVSKIVPSEDLSTMFAVMGLFEAAAGIIFPYIYPTYYQYLLTTKGRSVSEIFHLTAGLALIAFITYTLVFRLLKTKEQEEEEDNARKARNAKKPENSSL